VVYLLDKNRINPDVLAEAKTDLGGDGFAGQYQQVPVQEGGLIWQKWFTGVEDALFPKESELTCLGTDWDLAYTEKDENSASAYVTAGRIGGKMYISDLGWVRYEFPELIRFMKTQRAPHYVEKKAAGLSAKQVLIKHGIPAIEVEVSGDKLARARMATPHAEAGMCYIRKNLLDKLYNDSRQGILSFPRNADTDLADALAQAIQRIFKGGIVVGHAGGGSIFDGLRPPGNVA
jgi:predicted phage terminase large subunit-like protein